MTWRLLSVALWCAVAAPIVYFYVAPILTEDWARALGRAFAALGLWSVAWSPIHKRLTKRVR